MYMRLNNFFINKLYNLWKIKSIDKLLDNKKIVISLKK